MRYATIDEIESGFRKLSEEEEITCSTLIEESAIIIDSYNKNADEEKKRLVSCRMIRRFFGDGNNMSVPMGTSQATMSGLGYSQTWTLGSGGGSGELYISKLEKKLLGVGDRIGTYSPIECLAGDSK